MPTVQENSYREAQTKALNTMARAVLVLLIKNLAADGLTKAPDGETPAELLGYNWPVADLGLSRHTLELIAEKIGGHLVAAVRGTECKHFVELPMPPNVELGVVMRDSATGFCLRAYKYFDFQSGTMPVTFEIGVKA